MKRLVSKSIKKLAATNEMSMEDFLYIMRDKDLYTLLETVDYYEDMKEQFEGRGEYVCTYEGTSGGYYDMGFGNWLPDESEYEYYCDVDSGDAKDFIEFLFDEYSPLKSSIQEFLDLIKANEIEQAQTKFNISEQIFDIIDIEDCMDFKANTIISAIKHNLLSSDSVKTMLSYIEDFCEEEAE